MTRKELSQKMKAEGNVNLSRLSEGIVSIETEDSIDYYHEDDAGNWNLFESKNIWNV